MVAVGVLEDVLDEELEEDVREELEEEEEEEEDNDDDEEEDKDVEDFELVTDDEEADVEEAVVRVKLRVPVLGLTLVGVAKLLGISVKDTLWLAIFSAEVKPDALAWTVVARSEAVPHPYWKYPPSKTFL